MHAPIVLDIYYASLTLVGCVIRTMHARKDLDM